MLVGRNVTLARASRHLGQVLGSEHHSVQRFDPVLPGVPERGGHPAEHLPGGQGREEHLPAVQSAEKYDKAGYSIVHLSLKLIVVQI